MKPASIDEVRAAVKEYLDDSGDTMITQGNTPFVQGYVTRALARKQLLVPAEVLSAVITEINEESALHPES